jgi:uncharacterized membrane protein YdbT with pleckstrin-like domain
MAEQNEFEWLTLDEGEEILWSGEPRLKSIIPAVIFGIPFIAAAGIGVLIILGAYYNVKNTDYVVTDEGLYVKKGILSRSVQKIGFDKVQNISFSQGIFGKQFGYGSIEISTAGGSGVEMRFKSIDSPREVQDRITSLVKESTEEKTTEGRTEKELLEGILHELEELNEKVGE